MGFDGPRRANYCGCEPELSDPPLLVGIRLAVVGKGEVVWLIVLGCRGVGSVESAVSKAGRLRLA